MARTAASFDLGLPPVPGWIRNLLIALFGLWILEMVLTQWLHLPLDLFLVWAPPGLDQPWTVLTRILIQGPMVLNVLFGLLVLYFTLPVLDSQLYKSQMGWAAVVASVGATLLALGTGTLGITYGGVAGWSALATCTIALMGLVAPDREIRVFFVLPLKGWQLVYFEGALELLYILANRNTSSVEHLGAWLGILVWWYGFGPGAQRRKLLAKGKKVEKASHLRVVQGGQDQNWH